MASIDCPIGSAHLPYKTPASDVDAVTRPGIQLVGNCRVSKLGQGRCRSEQTIVDLPVSKASRRCAAVDEDMDELEKVQTRGISRTRHLLQHYLEKARNCVVVG